MRVIDQHRCAKHHRSARTFLKCTTPEIEVVGTGQLALLVRCGDVPRAYLERNLAAARRLRSEFAVFGCQRGCRRDHELVGVDIDATTGQETA